MASKVSRKAYADLEERAKRLSTRLRNNTKGKAMDVADAAVCAAGGVTSGALVYYKPELGGIDTRALAAAALLFAGFGGITKGLQWGPACGGREGSSIISTVTS